jgi:hypothetical protein
MDHRSISVGVLTKEKPVGENPLVRSEGYQEQCQEF